ncbi:PepSY domain-containing protein [Rubellimicrobium aerolatum]|uniref:PepSY domain-containing protein n=1 Tax=Rubellimicrobium aerolatum TaxID=490979 RepID=A0ABW0SE13_9RHOB|nr:PepSY domain-containing protein [Rubellimicrobium aerolatum]MBP1807013.1 putative membrane protein YkoI [Rubellimicrobium aerolatum]
MTMKTKIVAAGLLALSALGLGAAANAQQAGAGDDAAEAQALTQAPVKLADAITAAQSSTGGTVASIEFDNGDDGEASAWDVEVLMADGTFKDVVVNAQDGTVADDGETDDDHGTGQDDGESEDGDEG